MPVALPFWLPACAGVTLGCASRLSAGVLFGWTGVRLVGWVLADNPLFAAVRWGVFLKEGNFLLGSDVFVTDRQSDAYAVDAIPRGIFDEDYLRWIGVEVSDRSFETSPDRSTLGSPDGGRSRMWRR